MVVCSRLHPLAAIGYISITISRIVIVDIATTAVVFTISTAVGEANICLPFVIAKKLLLRVSAWGEDELVGLKW